MKNVQQLDIVHALLRKNGLLDLANCGSLVHPTDYYEVVLKKHFLFDMDIKDDD